MGRKWKRGILVGKREGNCTPTILWRFGLIIKPAADGFFIQDFNFPTNRDSNLSARKLGARLWEVEAQPKFKMAKMSKYGAGLGHFGGDGSGVSTWIETSAANQNGGINLRNEVALLMAEPKQRVKRVENAQKPSSPFSCCSSLETVHSRIAFSSNDSLISNGKTGESNHTRKTSTDLIKVLNRIWSLEERHALDMSLVDMLRLEVRESQARITELLQEKERDKQEIDGLTKRVAVTKVSRKNKEQDQIKDLVKSVEVKLEDEQNVRKYSQNLCDKRAQEVSETKALLHNALVVLGQEKKRRATLEDLCDAFANGIREYEQQVRFLKQRSNVDENRREDDSGLILHVSEAWLERMQVKQSDDNNVEKTSALDRLSSEIEVFLRAKQSGCTKKYEYVSSKKSSKSNIFRHSLEMHLNDPSSALWRANDEDDSDLIAVHYSPLQRVASLKNENDFNSYQVAEITSDDRPKETVGLKTTKKNDPAGKALKGDLDQCSTQSCNATIQRKTKATQRAWTTRKHSWTSEIKKLQYEDDDLDLALAPSTLTDPHSPVKKWLSETTANPDISQYSSRLHLTLKPNTLKAKALQTRLERQIAGARASKDLSQVD